jgi:hypothetical protein
LFRNVFDSHPELAVMHEGHFVGAVARLRKRYEKGDGLDRDTFVRDLYRNDNFIRQGLDRTTIASLVDRESPQALPEAIRLVMGAYASANGKRWYGDKTPGYVAQIPVLAAMFPEAKFVHIIRDGRDVATSYLEREEWGPVNLGEAALYWRSRVTRGRKAGDDLGPLRYREVRYEDMVDDPEGTTRALCEFLGLDFDPVMLEYHRKGEEFAATTKNPEAFTGLAQPVTKGMRDWRVDMAPDDVAFFETIAGDLLADLGYDVTGTGGGAEMRARAVGAHGVWQAKRAGARAVPILRRLRMRLLPKRAA